MYLPINTGGGQENYILFNDPGDIPELNGDAYFSLQLKATNSESEVRYLNVAVLNTSDVFEAIKIDISDSYREVSAGTNLLITVNQFVYIRDLHPMCSALAELPVGHMDVRRVGGDPHIHVVYHHVLRI